MRTTIIVSVAFHLVLIAGLAWFFAPTSHEIETQPIAISLTALPALAPEERQELEAAPQTLPQDDLETTQEQDLSDEPVVVPTPLPQSQTSELEEVVEALEDMARQEATAAKVQETETSDGPEITDISDNPDLEDQEAIERSDTDFVSAPIPEIKPNWIAKLPPPTTEPSTNPSETQPLAAEVSKPVPALQPEVQPEPQPERLVVAEAIEVPTPTQAPEPVPTQIVQPAVVEPEPTQPTLSQPTLSQPVSAAPEQVTTVVAEPKLAPQPKLEPQPNPEVQARADFKLPTFDRPTVPDDATLRNEQVAVDAVLNSFSAPAPTSAPALAPAPVSATGQTALAPVIDVEAIRAALQAQISSNWIHPPGQPLENAPVVPVRIYFDAQARVQSVEALEPFKLGTPSYRLWYESAERAIRLSSPLALTPEVLQSNNKLKFNMDPSQ